MTPFRHAIFARSLDALLDVRRSAVTLLEGVEQRLQPRGLPVAIKLEAGAGERKKIGHRRGRTRCGISGGASREIGVSVAGVTGWVVCPRLQACDSQGLWGTAKNLCDADVVRGVGAMGCVGCGGGVD